MNPDSKPPDQDPSLAAFESETAAFPAARPSDGHANHGFGNFGNYRILETLGEGGMGVVFLAEQTQPIKRTVALKVIKLGMDTKDVIARFEAERQALALMDHANVARVFDAGATDDGRPFFVMEHVAGVPITEHCDRQKLSVAERLELFMKVCEAVQHAHQKGIIHRDLKPSNILVAARDGAAVPKVIDFGVARATSQRLTERTVFTEQGQLIGTPEYMSPEQAEMSAQGVDTRTDIYALGVLLYELLTGSRPFESRTLRGAGLAEVQRIIRDVDPPTPSTRLNSLAAPSGDLASATRVAESRRTDLRALRGVLRRDLDWVVMKCLEKNRDRRYETANALAMELKRFLKNEPVLAGPPSLTYRLGRFSRRHRGPMIAGGLVAAVLVVATVVSVVFAITAERERAKTELALLDRETLLDAEREQRARAEQREREAIDARASEAQRAEELGQVAAFQARQLGDVDPDGMGLAMRDGLREKLATLAARRGLDDAATATLLERYDTLVAGADFTGLALETLDREIFTPSLEAIAREFDDQPLVRAQLLQSLAVTLREVGLLERAETPQIEALAIRRRLRGDEHPDTLASFENMSSLLCDQGKLAEAEPSCRETLAIRRRQLGDAHRHTLASMSDMASLLHAQGKLTEAEPLYRETLAGRRRVLGDAHADTIASIGDMGSVLQDQGRLDDAEPFVHEALAASRRVLGDDDPVTLNAVNNVGYLKYGQGKYGEAEAYFREVLAGCRRVHGDEHPDTLNAMGNVGALLHAQGKLAEAEPHYREALAVRTGLLGTDHPDTLTARNNIGMLMLQQARLDEAEAFCRAALDGRRRVLGDEHPQTLEALNNVGLVLQRQGRFAEAEPLYAEALAARRRLLGNEHAGTLSSISNMGSFFYRQGRFDEAEPYYREAVELSRRVLGDDHPETLTALNNLGALYEAQGRLDDAAPYLRESVAGHRRVLGDAHPATLNAIVNAGRLLNAQAQYAEAETLLRECLETGIGVLGANDWRVAKTQSLLGESLTGQGRYTEAETLLIDGHAGLEATLPEGRREEKLPDAIERIVRLYDAWGKPDQAEVWRGRLP